MSRRIAAFLLIAVSSVVPAWTQVTGRITGSINDPVGRSIEKAKIQLMLAGGSRAVAETESSAEGLFSIETIRPELYDLVIDAAGFQQVKLRNVKVDPARATDLPPVKMELAAATTSVEVTAASETVQTTVTDVSSTVTTDQILKLPVGDRNPLDFIATQAGVSQSAYGTAVNGQRVSASNMTLEGVNIQDTFIKDNALTFTPNLLELDSVQEFTVTTSNSTASNSGGSGVAFTIPSGTNQIHGAVYWQNRNSKTAANDWFANADGVALDRLNLNSLGAKAGGPIQRDRLFYFVNYEATRSRGRVLVDQPILTRDARQGIFTYRSNTGQITKVNVVNFVGLKIDPLMAANLAQTPTPDKINNYRVGDSQADQLFNTAGYSFQARSNRDRDSVTSRLDYSLSSRNSLSTSFRWNRDLVDRPQDGIGYDPTPTFQNDNASKLLAMAWRSTPNAVFTNELRGGLNFDPGYFIRRDKQPDFFVAGMLWGNPQVLGQEQGRLSRTYNLQDKATWVHGRHSFSFGYYLQAARTSLYDYFGTVPTYSVGSGSLDPVQSSFFLLPGELRGASTADTARANALIASLGGLLSGSSVQYNVTSRTSGFVRGAPLSRNWAYDNHAFYAEDIWRAARGLTVTAGVRWDYFSPVAERDSLALEPIMRGDARSTLLSNATLYFTGKEFQRPFYKRDLNNFGPNVGLAWDIFGKGKTSLRVGYSAKFVTDQQTTVASAYSATNAGLTASVVAADLSGFISDVTSRTPPGPPAYFVPRKFSDNFAIDPTSFFALVDPSLATPYVQEFTIGIQQEIKGTIIEARYVGNHAVKMLRGYDLNQIDINAGGFLADFQRAQRNGNLARTATGVFNPAYDPRIPGSQPLTVFPRMPGGGFLTAGVVSTLIDRGEPAELGLLYQLNRVNGNIAFYPNPNALVTVFGTNYANSRYDSLQIEARHRYKSGLEFQGSYTFSKWLGNGSGVEQLRFEPFMDVNNPQLDRSRSPFDITHQLKGNYAYDLPIVNTLHIRNEVLKKIAGGWSTSGVLLWQSGNPFSISSGRGTFLPEFLSGENGANTIYEKNTLETIVSLRKTPGGVYMVPASARAQNGQGVPADGAPAFTGQVFFNPNAGQIGSLQRRLFTGPSGFNLDAALRKDTAITDRVKAILGFEALNVFNHATFLTGDQNINSLQFGRVQFMMFTPRRLQMSLRISF